MSEAVIGSHASGQEHTDWKSTALKFLLISLVIFLLAEIAFYLVILPVTARVHLTVNGSYSVGYDEVCSLAGVSGAEKWIHFNTATIASRLAAVPLFESVIVEKKFPDQVVISVVERTAVAMSLGNVNGRTVPVEIDRFGVAFRIGNAPATNSIPLLTGLTFENPVAGMRLNVKLQPLLEQIASLGESNPVLLGSISEIKIEPKTYGGYDLVLYPVHAPVRVRTDRTLNEDALQYMMLVLDVVGGLSIDIEEIDIRAGTVAYLARGESI